MSFHLRAEWHALCVTLQKNLEGAMEMRAGFLLQVCGMMVNNIAFLVGWIFFFKLFGSINHWSFQRQLVYKELALPRGRLYLRKEQVRYQSTCTKDL